jgi:hypothetical protein
MYNSACYGIAAQQREKERTEGIKQIFVSAMPACHKRERQSRNLHPMLQEHKKPGKQCKRP